MSLPKRTLHLLPLLFLGACVFGRRPDAGGNDSIEDAASGAPRPSDTGSINGADTAPSTGLKVLVLDDGNGSAVFVARKLEALGHDAVVGPPYNDWRGNNPSIPDGDVILVMQTDKTDAPLTPEASEALVSASAGGAGIVRCGLAARIAASTTTPSNADLVLPVEDDAGLSESSEWWVLERDHAIAAELSTKWTESSTAYGASPKGDLDIEVVIEARGQFGAWPALVVREPALGPRQVYVNSTFEDDSTPASPLQLEVLDASVRWAAGAL